MALTDTFVRNAKSNKPAGQKHADGDGMYLLVTPTGKYWRLAVCQPYSPSAWATGDDADGLTT
jgi:hypothetical protein